MSWRCVSLAVAHADLLGNDARAALYQVIALRSNYSNAASVQFTYLLTVSGAQMMSWITSCEKPTAGRFFCIMPLYTLFSSLTDISQVCW